MDRLEHMLTLSVHRDIITAVAFSSDGSLLFSCAQDSCLRVHSLQDQQQIHSTTVGDLGLSSIIVLPDNDVSTAFSCHVGHANVVAVARLGVPCSCLVVHFSFCLAWSFCRLLHMTTYYSSLLLRSISHVTRLKALLLSRIRFVFAC